MKLLRKIISGLLVLSLTSAIMLVCLDATILRADFITAKADQTNIYSNLANQLTKSLATSSDAAQQTATQQALSSVITPTYVKGKLTTYLQGLEQHFRLGQPTPTLDFSDLSSKLAAAGITLPPDGQAQLNSQINQETAKSSQVSGLGALYHNGTATKWGLWVAAIILAGLLALASPDGRRLTTLAKAFIASAILLLVYYAILRYLPTLVAQKVTTTSVTGPLLASVNQLLAKATAGVASVVLRWIIGLGVLAAALFVAEPIINHRQHKQQRALAKDRTPLPVARRE